MNLTSRLVKEGKHDYKPGHGLGLRLRTTGFQLNFAIDADAWYDPSNAGPLGSDGRDINKIGGISYFSPVAPLSWPKNHRAVLFGWRPSPVKGLFQIFAYVNDKKGEHKEQLLGTVKAGERCKAFTGRWGKNTFRFSLSSSDRNVEIGEAELEVFTGPLQINVGPWFGGTLPSPKTHYLYTELIFHGGV